MGKWLILILYINCINFVMNKTIPEILFSKSLKIDQFLGRCPGYHDLVLTLEDVHFVTLKNNTISISAKIVATRNLLPQLKLVLKLERCKAREDLDSCEPYQDVNINNLCELQNVKNQQWSPFINKKNQTLPCPLKKGTYCLQNITVDSAPFMSLPIQGWYWKAKALLYETIPSTVVMCVYGTGICGLAVGHPFDTVKTRQQAKGLTLTRAIQGTLKYEGFLGFYQGFTVPFLTVGPANAVFFFTYAETLKLLQTGNEDVFRLDITHPTWKWNAALAGLVGGFVQVFVTCPVELIKTVMQISVMKDSNTPYAFKTTSEAIKGIYKLRGVHGFYKGCVPMMLRDVPASSLYTLVYETLLPRQREANIMDLIFAGGLAGCASWSIIVPFDVIKSKMQSDNMVKPKYKSMRHCARHLYTKKGWTIFTRGFGVTILRAFPVNACIFATYEGCLAIFKKLNIT